MSLRLAARATLPALFGFLLTLNLLRGGGLESFVAMIAAFVTQGGLLVGEFAALAGVRTLSYSRRLRAGVLMAVPLLAVGFVALIVYLYLGLGAEGASLTWVVSVSIGGGVIVGLLLGSALLLMPALALDADPWAAFLRAARTIWRIPAAMIVAAAYVGMLVCAVWLGPDQLLLRGVVPETAIALIRVTAGWAAVGVFGIPFWAAVWRLYVAPS